MNKREYIQANKDWLEGNHEKSFLPETYIPNYNTLIYKTKSPLAKKAGNNSVTKRLFIASGGLFWYKNRLLMQSTSLKRYYVHKEGGYLKR